MSKKRQRKLSEFTYEGDSDITDSSPYLKQHLLEAVDNQLRDNTPPVARETFERLQLQGYTVQQAKEKIAAVLVEDIYTVMTTQRPHDEAEYERKLRALK